jgi:hypothetical protein
MKNKKNFESNKETENLKNFKSINPEGVKGTILSGCDVPGTDGWCECSVHDDPGHHCEISPGYYTGHK